MRGRKTTQRLVEEVKAIAPLHDSIVEVARRINLPEQTVRDIIKRDDKFVELRAQQKKRLILQATKKAEEFLESLDPENAKSEMEKSTVFGTLVDKNAVLSGEQFKSGVQTFNIGNKQIIVEISKEAESLIKRGNQ